MKHLSIWVPILLTIGIIIIAIIVANNAVPNNIYGTASNSSSSTTSHTSLHVPSSQCQKLPEGNDLRYFGEASGEVVNKSDRTLRLDEWVKVFVTWQDDSGAALYTSWSFIDVHSLLPGATSTWNIDDSSFWNIQDDVDSTNMTEPATCSIHFEVFGIVVTPTFDSKTTFSK